VGARDREDGRTLLIDETETDRDEERKREPNGGMVWIWGRWRKII
jgi:hypothetical protein